MADFRVELASLAQPRPKTLLVKDIGYNARYDVIDSVPGGEELRMCLLEIHSWRQDQCNANRSGMASILVVLSSILVLNFV